MRFSTGYMDKAVFDLDALLAQAEEELSDVDFDTLVGTGFSGGIVVPALALRLKKYFLLVRKDSDDSHHSGKLLGNLGDRWIFVDDFVSGGGTRRRVMERVGEARRQPYFDPTPENSIEPTVYVGDYLYSYPETPWFPGGR